MTVQQLDSMISQDWVRLPPIGYGPQRGYPTRRGEHASDRIAAASRTDPGQAGGGLRAGHAAGCPYRKLCADADLAAGRPRGPAGLDRTYLDDVVHHGDAAALPASGLGL